MRKRIKIDPKCVPYSFRHTSITDAMLADVEVAKVAELPINIGIVVWTPHGVTTRFMPEENANFVDDPKLYNRWINFWSAAASKPKLELPNRTAIENSDPQFLEELTRTQKGNFMMFFAGRVHNDVAPSEIAPRQAWPN